jgi:hypothetical protein
LLNSFSKDGKKGGEIEVVHVYSISGTTKETENQQQNKKKSYKKT